MVGSKINHSAIEAYAKAFASKISDSQFIQTDNINGQQILKVTPVKQVNFLVLKNLFEVWQEETLKLQSPYFNYKNDQVAKALVAFMNVLSQNIEIKKDDFEKLLATSVQDCLYLMFAPFDYFWADLSQQNQSNLSVKSIKAKGKYFKFNKNIIDRFAERIEKDYETVVSQDDALQVFEAMIKAEEFDAEEPQDLIDQFTEVLTLNKEDFFEAQEEDMIGSLLIEEEEVEAAYEEEEPAEEEPEEKGSLFDEDFDDDDEQSTYHPRREEPADEATYKEEKQNSWFDEAPEELQQEDKTSWADEVAEEPMVEEIEQEPIEEIKPEKQQVLRRKEFTSEEIADTEGHLNSKFAKEKKTLHDQLQTGEEKITIADVHNQVKSGKMHESISVNQRYMFVNELFAGNSDAYTKAIEDIERCESFDDSVELMVQKYAKKLDWNMNSPEVKDLLKLIFKRFR